MRRRGVLVVVWDDDQAEPWMLLTDLPPENIGVCWYGLRVWIELGFRALKGVGWRWEHTRRTDPVRVARHWLVLTVATIWVMAYGTHAEDAELRGVPPGRLHTPPQPVTPHRSRRVSVFQRGRSFLLRQLLKSRPWRCLWQAPEPWPCAPRCCGSLIILSARKSQYDQYLPLSAPLWGKVRMGINRVDW